MKRRIPTLLIMVLAVVLIFSAVLYGCGGKGGDKQGAPKVSDVIEVGDDMVYRYNGIRYGILKADMFAELGSSEDELPLEHSGYRQDMTLSGVEFMVFHTVDPRTDSYDHTSFICDFESEEDMNSAAEKLEAELKEKFGEPARDTRETDPNNKQQQIIWGRTKFYTRDDGKQFTYSTLKLTLGEKRIEITVAPYPNPDQWSEVPIYNAGN